MAQPRIAAATGEPGPLGVTRRDGEINVAVVSRNATAMTFCLFDERGERETHRLPLTRVSDAVFAATIAGVDAGARYGLRADGPDGPDGAGHCFDPAKLLVDPYATALDRPFAYDDRLVRAARRRHRHRAADAEGDHLPRHRGTRGDAGPGTGLYLRGQRPDFLRRQRGHSPLTLRGTVAALRHPASLEHLVRLGVDTVELMPIAAWIDERHLVRLGLSNVWGYNPVAFMAPDPRLAPGGMIEIAETVSALHEAGIAVVLDAVYNHTGEGEAGGPTLSLRGLDNQLYFRHAEDGTLVNDTGTGNTLATERPEVAQLVVDAMRRWALATGIDGFRLDLAATLGRTADGFRQGRAAPGLDRSGPAPEDADVRRRAMGHRARRLPAREFSRRAGTNGTTSIATMSAASGAATRVRSERSQPASPAPPTSSSAPGGTGRGASTSSRRTTVSRWVT